MSVQTGKPAGYFKFILAMDCETTGINFDGDDPSDGYQAISWGIIVADAETLKPCKKLYVEIKWNEESKLARVKDPTYGKRAESIHGLTYEYLEEHGVSEQEAVEQIGSVILEFFGDGNIHTLGHNVVSFDLWFLKRIFRKFGIYLKFGARHIDTNSLGFVNFGTYTSDQLFNAIGLDERDKHDASEDVAMELEAARRMRIVFQSALED